MSAKPSPIRPLPVSDRRKDRRSLIPCRVDVSKDGAPLAYAELIDMSMSGLGLTSVANLKVGTVYDFRIEGIGFYSGKIVRQFEGNNYGAELILKDHQKREIQKLLDEMNGVNGA